MRTDWPRTDANVPGRFAPTSENSRTACRVSSRGSSSARSRCNANRTGPFANPSFRATAAMQPGTGSVRNRASPREARAHALRRHPMRSWTGSEGREASRWRRRSKLNWSATSSHVPVESVVEVQFGKTHKAANRDSLLAREADQRMHLGRGQAAVGGDENFVETDGVVDSSKLARGTENPPAVEKFTQLEFVVVDKPEQDVPIAALRQHVMNRLFGAVARSYHDHPAGLGGEAADHAHQNSEREPAHEQEVEQQHREDRGLRNRSLNRQPQAQRDRQHLGEE